MTVCVLQNDVGAWHHNGGVPAGHAGTAGNGWGSGVAGGSDMLAGQRGALVSSQQTSVSWHLLLHSASNFMDSRTVKMSGCKAEDIQYNEGRGALIKMRFFVF